MATFNDIVTRVVNKYKGPSSSSTTFVTQVELAVNDAIEFYQREHFWFSESTASVTLTAGDPEVTTASGFPTDFWYLHPSSGLTVVQSQSRYPLTKVSVVDYDYRNTQGTGRPEVYRELANTIQVYPYPNQAYTVEFRYIKKYVSLSGTQTNNFTIYAPQLIEARALSMLFLGQGQDGTEMRVYWAQEEERNLDALRFTSYQRIATGELEIDCL